MVTYWMTHKRDQEDGQWEPCTATTLRGAKCEAMRALGHGWADGVLLISVGDNVTEERVIIARWTVKTGKWEEGK